MEFFLEPADSSGYFNFEVNAGGTLLVYFIEDPTREADRLFRKYREIPARWQDEIRIKHTLPACVEPEIQTPVDWSVELRIPADLLETYAPGCWNQRDRRWRCNFFKCGDETSHPHWAAWSEIGPVLRFHQPDRFGWLTFEQSPQSTASANEKARNDE